MLPQSQSSPGKSPRRGSTARLFLNKTPVGTIQVKRWDNSWTYGEFEPNDAFSRFATIFGRWSLLMHEDEMLPLSDEAAEALWDAERMMDSMHARVYFVDDDQWEEVGQLSIDGPFIEWKPA